MMFPRCVKIAFSMVSTGIAVFAMSTNTNYAKGREADPPSLETTGRASALVALRPGVRLGNRREARVSQANGWTPAAHLVRLFGEVLSPVPVPRVPLPLPNAYKQ